VEAHGLGEAWLIGREQTAGFNAFIRGGAVQGLLGSRPGLSTQGEPAGTLRCVNVVHAVREANHSQSQFFNKLTRRND
jgi:hypothetical protein